MKKQQKIFVGMSGGVDSSVAAYLCKQAGHQVVGLFMKNWEDEDPLWENACPAEKDYEDVESVCQQLDIPYYSLEFIKEYREQVFQDFLQKLKSGETPNPDILCNREIKFKVFLDRAKKLGADRLATGHYCRFEEGELLKGVDHNKDQTYFLHAVPKNALEQSLFPIGHMQKSEVREVAKQAQLITSEKKDSTGICFIGKRNFSKFLKSFVGYDRGSIVDIKGKIVGEHEGLAYYTIGQRKGLGLGGPGEPWFVVDKDLKNNYLIVVRGDHPSLYRQTLTAQEVNWISPPEKKEFHCHAKIRYRQIDQACRVEILADGRVFVEFENPQRAITLRQSVVFYQGEKCLGGGFIASLGPSQYQVNKGLVSSQSKLSLQNPDILDPSFA